MAKQIVFVGLGKQNTKDHLPAALKNKDIKIVAVCDPNKELVKEWGTKLGVHAYCDISEMIAKERVDAAVVAVPHHAYMPILRQLISHGIHILKEKPFATSLKEALELVRLVDKHKVNLTVAVQRKHNKVFQGYQDYAKQIGEIFSIHGHYTINVPRLDSDWRSSKKLAGGGAVIDMGYHLIDLLSWYYGIPERISAELGYRNRADQDYDVEDTAKVQFSYPKPDGRRVLGSLLLSRIYPHKEEALSIYGINGTIDIFKDRIDLLDANKELSESIFIKSNGEDIASQFNAFIESLDSQPDKHSYRSHLQHMIFIDAIYRSASQGETILPFEDGEYTEALGLLNKVKGDL